mmetsp:Transcript_99162/g.137736  ORF Transcript_99162/g.137736 Transcript_99162/m.137736 type:complete len:221 (+) Transcript_99162:575-1237(+)
MGKRTSGLKGEEKDAGGVDISGGSVSAVALGEFGGSVVLGALAHDLSVLLLDVSEIEVSDLELVVLADQDVLRLDVQMVDAVGVEVLQTLNELVEVSSDDLFHGEQLLVGQDDVSHGTVRSILHKDDRGILGLAIGHGGGLRVLVSDLNDVLVVDLRESGLVLVVLGDFVVLEGEDLKSVLSVFGLGEVHLELSLGELLDNRDLREDRVVVVSGRHFFLR